MKKRVCICLILLLFLEVFIPAFGESLDSALDKAFEKGRLSFERIENPMPVPESCEFSLPPAEVLEAWGLSGISAEEVSAMLRQAQLTVINYSPDGTHGVGYLVSGDSFLPAAVSQGRIAIIYPTHERGVDDQFNILEKYYQQSCLQRNTYTPFGMGEEGTIWSPSGRYCCSLYSDGLFKMGKGDSCSPIFTDTHTGEMFLADSFNPSLFKGDAGSWVCGCFSDDEQYFYAMYYGHRFEHLCTLVRYDLATLEYEELYGMDINGYPTLTQLKDGTLLTFSDTRQIGTAAQQLIKVYPGGATESSPIDELMRISQDYALYYRRLYCSGESGWAVMPASLTGKTAGETALGFLRFRPEESLSERTDVLWMICAQTLQPESFSKEKLAEYYASEFDRYWADKDYLFIYDIKLSPEGRYAAVIAGSPEGRLHDQITVMLIIRLSDLKTLVAGGIDVGNVSSLAVRRNKYLLNLSDEGVLCMSDGGLYWLSEQ
ncbi:MAG: hypothetical protein K5663_12155 [Clostridiales bacterium]|nr:hypothetical protein [Clostridiales bacterium]